MQSTVSYADQKNNEYAVMIENFINQKGDKGAQLLSVIGGYVRKVGYNNSAFSLEDQEDVLQEISIKILNNYKKIKNNSYGWLFKVSHNECLNRIKKNVNSKGIVLINSSNEIVDLKKDTVDMPYFSNDIINYIDCFDYILDEIVKQSGNSQDKEIYIKYIEGFNNEDIAKSVNREKGAIAKRLSILRSRAKEFFLKFC